MLVHTEMIARHLSAKTGKSTACIEAVLFIIVTRAFKILRESTLYSILKKHSKLGEDFRDRNTH